MKKKFKNWLINFSLICFSVLIALGIGELAIRALYKDQMVLFPRYHTSAEYGEFTIRRTRPNMKFKHTSVDGKFFFKTNNKGFRSDEDIDYDKEADEIRVLCLGDSHTFGYEVNQEETYAHIIEERLKAQGLKATAINTGVSGFSTAEQLVLLENEGIKYDPDYVVIGLYSNDFSDNLRADLFQLEGDSLIVNQKEYLPGIKIQDFIYSFGIIHFLGENSYLYNYAFSTVWEFYKKMSSEKAQEKLTEYAIGTKEAYSDYDLELMEALIARMYGFTQENNVKLIIADIPQTDMNSSVPEDLVEPIRNLSDTLFYAQDLIPEYEQMEKTHLPNGHQHISDESHYLIGAKVADYILSERNVADSQ